MNQQSTVERFYEALARADAETMASCYAEGAVFSDPAFPELQTAEVRGMWRMLCRRSKDLRVEYKVEALSPDHFQVHWDAFYTFSQSGRPVHNSIRANLYLRNGLIVRHVDEFSFWRWSRQALGLSGWILGWTPFLRTAVRKQAAKNLQMFLQKNA